MPLAPIGFWSYTRSDDRDSAKRLSQLRLLLAGELRQVTGHRKVDIFQDVMAIPYGTDWLEEITRGLNASSFLIPIVTPTFLNSKPCCEEVLLFRQREEDLGRNDLIFPFHYIDVLHIEDHEVYDLAVLALLKSRQRFDFDDLRFEDFSTSSAVMRALAALARGIRAALRRDVSPPSPVVVSPLPLPATVVIASPSPPLPPPAPVPGDVIREGPGPEMVLIPAGRFLMGSTDKSSYDDEQPTHRVTIARPFWLGRYPVTRGEYRLFANETGKTNKEWLNSIFNSDENHPVVNINRLDAEAYTIWLSRKTNQNYYLPSEAEWEYAARAGTETPWYWGDTETNWEKYSCFERTNGTCRVGLLRPNAFGLYDMLGNVWEWTADSWHPSYEKSPRNGSAWISGEEIGGVVRGGSWVSHISGGRAARRGHADPVRRDETAGFRCARFHP